MKPNTLKEQLEILLAANQGKEIEFTALVNKSGGWCNIPDVEDYAFSFNNFRYRIKREPREWWLGIHEDAYDEVSKFSCIRRYGKKPDNICTATEIVHVREVL